LIYLFVDKISYEYSSDQYLVFKNDYVQFEIDIQAFVSESAIDNLVENLCSFVFLSSEYDSFNKQLLCIPLS